MLPRRRERAAGRQAGLACGTARVTFAAVQSSKATLSSTLGGHPSITPTLTCTFPTVSCVQLQDPDEHAGFQSFLQTFTGNGGATSRTIAPPVGCPTLPTEYQFDHDVNSLCAHGDPTRFSIIKANPNLELDLHREPFAKAATTYADTAGVAMQASPPAAAMQLAPIPPPQLKVTLRPALPAASKPTRVPKSSLAAAMPKVEPVPVEPVPTPKTLNAEATTLVAVPKHEPSLVAPKPEPALAVPKVEPTIEAAQPVVPAPIPVEVLKAFGVGQEVSAPAKVKVEVKAESEAALACPGLVAEPKKLAAGLSTVSKPLTTVKEEPALPVKAEPIEHAGLDNAPSSPSPSLPPAKAKVAMRVKTKPSRVNR